jgi:hypothetical protein
MQSTLSQFRCHAAAPAYVLAIGLLASAACSPSSGAPVGADAAAVDAGADTNAQAMSLSQVVGYLQGDFDNSAQVGRGFSKLVERHVCQVPSRPGNAQAQYLYVEQVEIRPQGRDAYYTRMVLLTPQLDGSVLSKVYKLAPTHPLASDAFKFNGPRDGCLNPALLDSIKDTDLVYRDGCDVTFTQSASDRFNAATTGTNCSFPGGYIETTADVFAGGLTTKDQVVSGGTKSGDSFEFRRILNWQLDAGSVDAAIGDASADR